MLCSSRNICALSYDDDDDDDDETVRDRTRLTETLVPVSTILNDLDS